jgi:hypothetical protein
MGNETSSRKKRPMTHEERIYRLAQVEMAMKLLSHEIEQHNARANWDAAQRAYAARMAAQKPTPPAAPQGPESLPENPSYEQIRAAARAERKPVLQSVINPLVTSPGANIRMGK